MGEPRRWLDIYHLKTTLEAHGTSLNTIKEWRAGEFAAGRPSGFDDYFAAHRLCRKCECTGLVMLGKDGDGHTRWDVCPVCEGSGTLPGRI